MEKNRIVEPNIYFKILKELILNSKKQIKSQKESFLFSTTCLKIDSKILSLENGAYFSLCLLDNQLKEDDLVFYLMSAINNYVKDKFNIDIKNKYPNSLFKDGKKIGEVISYRFKKWVMLGVAINLKDNFENNVDENYFTSLNLDVDINEFIDGCVKYIFEELKKEKEDVYQSYTNEMMYLNSIVTLNNNKQGTIKGVGLDNQLIVELLK